MLLHNLYGLRNLILIMAVFNNQLTELLDISQLALASSLSTGHKALQGPQQLFRVERGPETKTFALLTLIWIKNNCNTKCGSNLSVHHVHNR